MAWVSSLRSVSNSRLPGRTCPSGRWLAVVADVALAASRSLIAAVRAWPAAGSTVALPPLPGWRARIPAASIASGAPPWAPGQLGACGADLVASTGFGGVGDHPGRVVVGVGVAVQRAGGEVFAGALEVLLGSRRLPAAPRSADRRVGQE